MHLAQRAYLFILLTAVLAVAGIWSSGPGFSGLWRVPAVLLLIGLAVEAYCVRKLKISVEVDTGRRAFLGREQPASFAFSNRMARGVRLEYAPVLPAGLELVGYATLAAALFEPGPAMATTRRVVAPAGGVGRDSFSILPVQLGPQSWPAVPVRLLGVLGLVWWTREMSPAAEVSVTPDTSHGVRRRSRGSPVGARPRRVVGAGSELHQLRAYLPGDPPARIDWKATARARKLVTREFSEDQHLDVLVAIDAGRFSRVRAGRLDRFGLYANIAARFAEVVTPNDDRIGLLVFADRTLAMCVPDRGMPAVRRLRRTLEGLSVQQAESDPVAAAVRIRSVLKHRSLVVLLTDLEDTSMADQFARAVRLLSPPHLVVVAGVRGEEIPALACQEARDWIDPWIALAAQDHEARGKAQRLLLRRLGAPVIATREELLGETVLAEYERLRRSRRV